MQKAKTADEFFKTAEQWRAELSVLRKILKSTDLVEEVKWGGPCYTINGANVVGLGAFKSYFGLWFFQGALLRDAKKVLVNAQEGRTMAQRQWRMTSAQDIDAALVRKYAEEAIALARAGKAVEKSAPKALVMPVELKKAFASDKGAATSFKSLTPGKQREYADYVSEAKQDATKEKRIAKILPMICAGVGLNDQYRNC